MTGDESAKRMASLRDQIIKIEDRCGCSHTQADKDALRSMREELRQLEAGR